jgi:hypothetical protein
MSPTNILDSIRSFKLRERIVCNDGATVSVQAGQWHYSIPRSTSDFFTHVEAGFPTGYVPVSWRRYAENKNNLNETIYPYLPIYLLDHFIMLHDGLASGELPLRHPDETE